MNTVKKILTTYFFTGYCPVSGTVASFFTLPLVWVFLWLNQAFSPVIYPIATIIICIISVPLSGFGARLFEKKDPHEVVIDEVAGQMVTFLFIPYTMELYKIGPILIMGFLLFRIFDISKIPPLRQLERLPGGWGIAFDDIVGGIMANIVLHIILRLPVAGYLLPG